MQAYQENISAKVSGVLSPVLGVQVTVTDTATGNPAALYTDNGVTSIAQPLVTDETGYFGFRAANGQYTLSFASAQIKLASRVVQLYDPADDTPLTQAQAATASGASKIGYGQRTVENKLGDIVNAKDNGADPTGVLDCSVAVNTLLAQHTTVRFTPGTFLFTSDMVMLTGNHVIVEAGARLLFSGARMTSYLQSHIKIEVHGEISFVGTTTAPARAGWPSDTGGVGPTTTNERACIEFGGISSSLQSDFCVFGTGKIYGDWTGVPSIATLWTGDLNFKGIGTFYSNDVDVSGVEIYGFRGEAVYNYTSVAAKNIRFHNLRVHDVNFNALNFNALADLSNSFIENNIVDTAWQGVELSSGTARKNTVRNCQSHPVQFGGGVVLNVNVDDNDIYVGTNSGLNGINAAGNPASITGVAIVSRNRIYGATQSGIYAVALASFKALGNVVSGYATNVTTSTNGYAISIDANVAKTVVRDTACNSAGAGANGSIRCLSPNASIKNTQTEDTASGNILHLAQGPLSSATTTQREYRLITGVGASGIGFETVYGNGVPEALAAVSPFAKTSAILTAVSGGEVGTYTIHTYKPLGSSTLGPSFVIDNFGQPQPAQDKAFNFGINGQRWATVWAVNLVLAPPASATPANNGDMTFQLTSNTQLAIKVKGSDGVVRSTNLTLA